MRALKIALKEACGVNLDLAGAAALPGGPLCRRDVGAPQVQPRLLWNSLPSGGDGRSRELGASSLLSDTPGLRDLNVGQRAVRKLMLLYTDQITRTVKVTSHEIKQ